MDRTWVLCDVERGVYVDQLAIGPRDLDEKLAGPLRVTKRRLRGGLTDGVDVIAVDNGRVQFTIVPTRGMGLHRLAVGDRELGWRSPIRGPVHPSAVNLYDPSGLGWLDGFDEFLCRCGLESNGAPEFDEQGRVKYPLHGRIANCPAWRVELGYDAAVGELVVRGVVDESRFHFQKLRLTTTIRTRPGEAGLRIRDEVTNVAGVPGSMQLLYHVNFGGAVLDAGAKVVVPAKTIIPRNERAAAGIQSWDHYAAEQPGFEEQVYLFQLAADAGGQTRTLLRNAHGTLGASLRFDVRQLPCFTLWKDTAAAADGYVTGLEPGTNYPNPRSHESAQQRVVPLQPGQSRTFDLAIEVHFDAAAVAAAEQAVAALQTAPPTIHTRPQPGWCAGY